MRELAEYIEEYAHLIYVREQIDGKWQSVALTDLEPRKAMHHAMKFLMEGRKPVRLRTQEEMNEPQA